MECFSEDFLNENKNHCNVLSLKSNGINSSALFQP